MGNKHTKPDNEENDIQTDLTQNWFDTSNTKHDEKFKRTDELIGEYYALFGITNYFDHHNNGRFMQYVMDNEQLNSEEFYKKITEHITQFSEDDLNKFTEFDVNNFPINNNINYKKTAKKHIILFILKYCVKYDSIPENQVIKQWVERNPEYQGDVKSMLITTKSNKKCICGNILSKVQDSWNLYDARGVFCDICGDKNEKKRPFWHCDEQENVFHAFGYDVCERCIVNYDNNHCNASNDSKCTYDTQYGYDSCTVGIGNCIHLQQFLDAMNKNNVNMDQQTALDITNHYLHLLHLHDIDEDFEYIYHKMGQCDISKCSIFRRNTRDRLDTKENNDVNNDDNKDNAINNIELVQLLSLGFDKNMSLLALQISNNNIEMAMDYLIATSIADDQYQSNNKNAKEHEKNDVYLPSKCVANPYEDILDKMHCHFMHSYDNGNRLTIKQKQMVETHETKTDHDSNDHELIDRKILIINKILNDNRNVFRDFHYRKFNQLFTEQDSKNDTENIDFKFYNFGICFKYGYKGELEPCFTNARDIKPMYSSLKQELLSNPKAVLSIDQFNNEYMKARISFNSWYCKQTFIPIKKRDNQTNSAFNLLFHIRYVLVLMIYCNYDYLSYEFSKTYRDNYGSDHKYFYHLGKYIKIACREFAKSQHSKVTKFYHGVGEQLLPSSIFELKAYGPISTSSSFEVAVNFSNENKGIVLEFDKGQAEPLSVSWLSDFANEKEHLFIQTQFHIILKNISNPNSGIDYTVIFQAIHIIGEEYSEYTLKDTYQELEVSDSMICLISSIMSHQLSYTISRFQPFHSLTGYGKTLCDTFFKQIEHFNVNALHGKLHDLDASPWNTKRQWFDKQILNALFPNTTTITVNNVKLDVSADVDYWLNDIKQIFKNEDLCQVNKINIMPIYSCEEIVLSAKQTVDKYHDAFRSLDVLLMACTPSGALDISKHSDDIVLKCEMAWKILKDETYYFNDSNDEILNLIETAMNKEILLITNPNYFIQNSFRRLCAGKDWIHIKKKQTFNDDPNLSMYHYLCETKLEWIKLDLLSDLFPNLTQIKIYDVTISDYAINNLLHVLTNNDKTRNWADIDIDIGNDSDEICCVAKKWKQFKNEETITNETIAILREVTNYKEEGDIRMYDWGDLSILNQYIDAFEKQENDMDRKLLYRYCMNKLIATYCDLKYHKQFEMIGFEMYASWDWHSISFRRNKKSITY